MATRPGDPALLPHDSRGGHIFVGSIVCSALAMSAVVLRLCTRHFVMKKFYTDDWMAVVSLVSILSHSLPTSGAGKASSLTSTQLCLFGMNITQGLNTRKALGRHIYDLEDMEADLRYFLIVSRGPPCQVVPDPTELGVDKSGTQLAWQAMIWYNAGLMFVKMTFLLQYYRIFRQLPTMRKAYLSGIVIIGLWSLAQVVCVLLPCIPVSAFWNAQSGAKCQNQSIGVWVNAAGNLATDIVIILLPLPSLLTLKLPKAQKGALIAIFSIGFL